MKKFLLELPDDLHAAIKKEVAANGGSVAAYIREPLYRKLKRAGYKLGPQPKNGGKREGAGAKSTSSE